MFTWYPAHLSEEEADEALLGYRAWRLGRTEEGSPRLASTTPRPSWQPREAPAATCSGSHTRLYMVFDPTAEPHRCPDKGCTCGWHAVSDPATLVRPGGPADVVGQVSLWGRVIEHTRGYRAEYAYPARLRLTCRRCARTGRWPAIPRSVAIRGADTVPACAEHEPAVGRKADDVRDARTVESALLDAYGVELLPVEAMPSPDRVDMLTRLRRVFDR